MIDIASEFSRFPGGRFIEDGPYSGQQFRTSVLLPALRENDRVVVKLDGAVGYSASFLEEAFGGAVAELGLKFVQDKLVLRAEHDPLLLDTIHRFMQRAGEKASAPATK